MKPAAAAFVALALVLTLAPSADGRAAGGPTRSDPVARSGSDGIGDDYFPLDGNGGIDVQRYEIHDTYRFRSRRLSGWTRLTITATEPLTAFNLDLLLPVTGVTVDGEPAAHDRPDPHELTITPVQPLAAGRTFDVVVRYVGHPADIAWEGESNWVASSTEVIAVNQPHMATWWFPANDHPRDKALMDISISVPRGKVVVAGGRRVGREVTGAFATTRWRSVEPMAPYLAYFAAGPFEVERGTHRGLPWVTAVSRAIPDADFRRSQRLMRHSARLTSWLQTQLGPYPFGSTGGVTTSLTTPFALEDQTRPVYPVLAPGSGPVVVHELAHQWFGDSVSVDSWHDIWLNEGAATFMEVRYGETRGRIDGARWLQQQYDEHHGDADFWQVRLDDPGVERLFDHAVYVRGAMLLQALRGVVGERAFWTLLRRWVDQHAGGNASTEDFEAMAEQVSGRDLAAFFAVWLRGTTRPARTSANGLL